ncbi:16S RNA methylase RsmC [Bifidobacterium sp. GSD1FS]|uniref:16S RNA methylase RsmC n=2 Tax=Bifidobacterium canis TaxID=2610880 RepID=A0A7K1J2L1_9BIFI|nr:16S RNA methylase RsmC [Bifidobacterium canis]
MSDERAKNANEQYFSASPSSKDVRKQLEITLRDHPVTVETSNGVFSAHRVDLGTSVLLRHAPMPPLEGTFLDLGCGWGAISLALALESPDATVYAVDVNERAIELTRHNAQVNGCGNIHAGTAAEVPESARFDVIWSNPPIRIGKDALHELLMEWLPRLAADGHAYLVVQRNLGSDSLIKWLAENLGEGYDVSKYASSKGYRVIDVHKLA